MRSISACGKDGSLCGGKGKVKKSDEKSLKIDPKSTHETTFWTRSLTWLIDVGLTRQSRLWLLPSLCVCKGLGIILQCYFVYVSFEKKGEVKVEE